MLYRKFVAIAPFAPRTEIVAHARITRDSQRHVSVGGAVAALAIRDDFALRIEPELRKLLAQLSCGLEAAVDVDAMRPVAMNRIGDGAGVLRADALAEIFL